MRQGEPRTRTVRGSPMYGKTKPANDTVNIGSGNKEKRKREGDSHGTNSTAQTTDTQDTTRNTRQGKQKTFIHTRKKGTGGGVCV